MSVIYSPNVYYFIYYATLFCFYPHNYYIFSDEYYDDDDYSNSFEDDCISPSDGNYKLSNIILFKNFDIYLPI